MIKLKSFTENDFEQFILWVDSEEFIVQFAGPIFSYPITKAQLKSYIIENKQKAYKVIHYESNRAIGHA